MIQLEGGVVWHKRLCHISALGFSLLQLYNGIRSIVIRNIHCPFVKEMATVDS